MAESLKPELNTIITNLNQNKMRNLISFFKKMFTHNRCDTCGFTKDNVYVTEYYAEAGLIQCDKCYNELNKSE